MTYRRDYLLSLASQGTLLQREYDAALTLDAQRWGIHSDLGVSLHAMRQLGHWHPFTRRTRDLLAAMAEMAIDRSVVEQQSPRPDPRSNPNARY